MGGRHRKNEYPKIRRGASLIAQKFKKNIVMLNIDTSFDFLQNHQPIYEAGEEPVAYTIDYLGQIYVNDYIEKCPDDVTFKTLITKEITKTLYKKQK